MEAYLLAGVDVVVELHAGLGLQLLEGHLLLEEVTDEADVIDALPDHFEIALPRDNPA